MKRALIAGTNIGIIAQRLIQQGSIVNVNGNRADTLRKQLEDIPVPESQPSALAAVAAITAGMHHIPSIQNLFLAPKSQRLFKTVKGKRSASQRSRANRRKLHRSTV